MVKGGKVHIIPITNTVSLETLEEELRTTKDRLPASLKEGKAWSVPGQIISGASQPGAFTMRCLQILSISGQRITTTCALGTCQITSLDPVVLEFHASSL
jgi:hypothetical protein